MRPPVFVWQKGGHVRGGPLYFCNNFVCVKFTNLTLFSLALNSDSGLKNDHVAETFFLKHEIDGNFFPCRYIKIGEQLKSDTIINLCSSNNLLDKMVSLHYIVTLFFQCPFSRGAPVSTSVSGLWSYRARTIWTK